MVFVRHSSCGEGSARLFNSCSSMQLAIVYYYLPHLCCDFFFLLFRKLSFVRLEKIVMKDFTTISLVQWIAKLLAVKCINDHCEP